MGSWLLSEHIYRYIYRKQNANDDAALITDLSPIKTDLGVLKMLNLVSAHPTALKHSEIASMIHHHPIYPSIGL